MKQFKFLIILVGTALGLYSCSDDNSIKDPIYEFIFFQNESVVIGEAEGSTEPVPVALKLLGYEVKSNIVVNLSVEDTNVEEGVDYTISSRTLTFKPGNFVSDTLYVSTIDNNQGVDYERSFNLKIETISNPDIKVGFGLENPTMASLKVTIADDECSDTIDDVFNGALANQTTYDTHNITGTVSGSEVTVMGNLISYNPFSNAELKITLTPESQGATKGTATFNDYNAGKDSDGYEYQFRQVGVGSYDVCTRKITVDFKVYWLSGSGWKYWYTSYNTITMP